MVQWEPRCFLSCCICSDLGCRVLKSSDIFKEGKHTHPLRQISASYQVAGCALPEVSFFSQVE